jgi:hypothetical protein
MNKDNPCFMPTAIIFKHEQMLLQYSSRLSHWPGGGQESKQQFKIAGKTGETMP